MLTTPLCLTIVIADDTVTGADRAGVRVRAGGDGARVHGKQRIVLAGFRVQKRLSAMRRHTLVSSVLVGAVVKGCEGDDQAGWRQPGGDLAQQARGRLALEDQGTADGLVKRQVRVRVRRDEAGLGGEGGVGGSTLAALPRPHGPRAES